MNRVLRDTGAKYPIVQAPMGWIARSQLASAVSNAGGLGVIETSSGEVDICKEEIKKISSSLGLRPKEFVRKNESDFRDKGLAGNLEDDEKMIKAMAAYPKIIERPIVVLKSKAVIGRPPENVLKLI